MAIDHVSHGLAAITLKYGHGPRYAVVNKPFVNLTVVLFFDEVSDQVLLCLQADSVLRLLLGRYSAVAVDVVNLFNGIHATSPVLRSRHLKPYLVISS